MSGPLEVELKLGLVEPDDLPRLLAQLPTPEAVVEQRNFYYVDDGGAVEAARIMLRVREAREGGALKKVVVTAKRRLNTTDGLFVAEEHESVADPVVWERVLAGADLRELGGEALSWVLAEAGVAPDATFGCLGVLANVRHRVLHAGYVLEVDRTTFDDGTVDAEVEVETDDVEGARRVVEAAAAAAGVALFDQQKGKHRRFRERLKR